MTCAKITGCLTLLTLMLGAHASVMACECSAKTLDEATHEADEIFFGKVAAFDEVEGGDWAATFDVERAYKGKTRTKGSSVIQTREDAKACGVQFRIGSTYMVYASREGDTLKTSTCALTQKLKRAPIAPEVRGLAPVVPAQGALVGRVSQASMVFVGQVKEVGKGYAGSFDDVLMEVKVETSFKGARRGKTVVVRYDEKSCPGKSRSLLDDDVLHGTLKAPVEVGESYLFFTHGESPVAVAACHGNHVAVASAPLDELKALCKGKTCEELGRGHAQAAKLRAAIGQKILSQAKISLDQCAGEAALYSSEGAITALDMQVRARSDGKVDMLDIRTRGTHEGGAMYDAAVECVAGKVALWGVPAFDGGALELDVLLRMKEGARGPRFVRDEVTMRQ